MTNPAEHPLRVIIVDDEQPARTRLRELLGDCARDMAVVVVGEASNGRKAIELMQGVMADLILLDIRMPEMGGIELARHLMKLPDAPAVVFTTAYDAHAIEAFEVNAVDYLLKPVRKERLLAALNKTLHSRRVRVETLEKIAAGPRTNLSIHERGKLLLIPVADIVYLKAELKYVTVRTRERDYLVDESLLRLEQEFAERFVRVHRNCLVARSAVKGFEKAQDNHGELRWTVLLMGVDEKLPVSRRQQHVVKEFRNG